MVHENLGDLEFNRQAVEQACEQYDKSYELALDCLEREPERYDWQWQLVYCLDKQIKVHQALKNLEQELDIRQQAVVMRSHYAVQDQSNRDLINDLFVDAHLLIDKLLANAEIERAGELLQTLQQDWESWNPQQQQDYQQSWNTLKSKFRTANSESSTRRPE